MLLKKKLILFIRFLKFVLSLVIMIITTLWLLYVLQGKFEYPKDLSSTLTFFTENLFEPLLGAAGVLTSIVVSVEAYFSRKNNSNKVKEITNDSNSNSIKAKKIINSKYKLRNFYYYGSKNYNFIGREHIIGTIENNFFLKKRNFQIVVGIDGIGKTQLALEYAYLQENKGVYKNAIWFIRANTFDIFEDDLRLFSESLHNSDNYNFQSTAEEKYHYLAEWLKNTEDWLLIIDNVNSVNILEKFLIGIKGNIIVTTNNPDLTHLFPDSDIIVLNSIERKFSVELLQKISNNVISPEIAEEIAKKLGNIPLLLELVARNFIQNKAIVDILDIKYYEDQTEYINNQINKIISPIFKESFIKFSFKGLLKTLTQIVSLNTFVFFNSQKIPIFFVFEVLKEYTLYYSKEDLSRENLIVKILFKILFNNRWYNASIIYYDSYLNKLKSKSIIEFSESKYLNIHKVTQNLLLRNWITIIMSNRLSLLSVKMFLEYTYQIFLKSNKENSSLKKQDLFPHMANLIRVADEYDLSFDVLIKIAKSVSDYLQDNRKFITAEYFTKYAHSLERKLYNKSSIDLLKEHLLNTVQSFKPIDGLLEEIVSLDLGNLSYERFIRGYQKLLNLDLEGAAILFEEAIFIADQTKSDVLNKPPFYVLFSLSLSNNDTDKCLYYLKKSKELYNKKIYLELEIIEASIYANLSFLENSKDNYNTAEQYYKESNIIYNKILQNENIVDTQKCIASIDNALLALNFDDYSGLLKGLNYLNIKIDIIMSEFSEMPLMIGDFFLIQSASFYYKNDYRNCEENILKAIEYYSNFLDNAHPRIQFAKNILLICESSYRESN